ncbi:hypothetical protein V8F06_012173 [Rhypophila decipiens]
MSVTITLPPRMERQVQEQRFPRAPEADDVNDNIRKGVPKLSTLERWNARFRSQQRIDAERRRLAKGKQVETIENGSPVRADSELPDNGPAEQSLQSVVNTREPSAEEGATQASPSSEKHRPGPALLGLEQLRPPPPMTIAPLIPPQPVELSSTSTTRSIPVSVRFSKLERVRQMKLKSSKEVNAREIPLSKSELEKMRTFSEFVGTPNQVALFGRQLPQCYRYAVQLELDGSEAQTYICIEGLRKKEDISDFYAVMSQKKYRKYYEPWKICFRTVEVSNCADVLPHGQGMEDTTGSFRINPTESKLTLCSSYVKLVTGHGERVSTIGGVIQLGSELFALTTAHTLGAHLASPTEATSAAQTLRDEDFPDDLEKILILMADAEPKRKHHKPTDVNWSHVELSVAPRVYEHHGEDWCLLPLPKQYQLPNADWTSDTASYATAISEVYNVDPVGLSVHSLFGPNRYAGFVSLAPSFLDGEHGPVEVWAVHLDIASPDLARGDSGLWFLSRYNEAVGTAVASSPGKALMTLLSHQFKSVSEFFPDHAKPTLPDSMLMMLRAAKHFHETDSFRSNQLIDLLFMILKVKTANPPSLLHRTLRRALRNWEHSKLDIENLKRLITISGSDLEDTLRRILSEQSLESSSDISTAQKLALLYGDLENTLPDLTPPPSSPVHPPGSSATLSAPTREPPDIPRPPVIQTDPVSQIHPMFQPQGIPKSQPEPYSTLEVNTPPRAKRIIVRTVLGPTKSVYKWCSNVIRTILTTAKSLYRWCSTWSVVILLLFIILSYLAGIGIGAWKLLTSDLSSGVKIGAGVALILSHLALLLSAALYISGRRRRLRNRWSPPEGPQELPTEPPTRRVEDFERVPVPGKKEGESGH